MFDALVVIGSIVDIVLSEIDVSKLSLSESRCSLPSPCRGRLGSHWLRFLGFCLIFLNTISPFFPLFLSSPDPLHFIHSVGHLYLPLSSDHDHLPLYSFSLSLPSLLLHLSPCINSTISLMLGTHLMP